MSVAVKKSTVRRQHALAIESYQQWLRENPDASKRRRMKIFDAFVDNAHKLKVK